MSERSFASFSVPLWGLNADSPRESRHLLLNRGHQPLLGGQLLAGGAHFVRMMSGVAQGRALAVARPVAHALTGYVDDAGQWAIEPRFESTRAMADCGLARFQRDGLWGYVAADGRIAVEPRYQRGEPFSAEGLAAVSLDDKDWHYIDTQGRTVIPGPFRRADSFAHGLARVVPRGKGDWRFIDAQGRFAFDAEFDLALSFGAQGVAPVRDKQGLWGLIDRQGRWVLSAQHDDIDTFNADGLAAFRPKQDPGGYYRRGYLNARGEVVVEPVRDMEEHMVAGCARIDRRRFVNVRGQPLHEERNTWAERFSPLGVAFVLRDERWGLLDTAGRYQVLAEDSLEPMTDNDGWIEGFDEQSGLAPVLMRDGSVSHIDVQGRLRFRQLFFGAPKGLQTALYAVADGQAHGSLLVWQSEPGVAVAQPEPFLMPRAAQFATSACQEPALSAHAQQLAADSLKALARYAEGAPRAQVRQAGDTDEDEDDDEDDLPACDDRDHRFYGRSLRLARAYLDETVNGYYDGFLSDHQHRAIQALFDTAKQQLSERWGPSDLNPDCEYERGVRFTKGAWALGDAWVLLEIRSDTGDGDIWVELWLQALPGLDQVDLARRRRTAVLESAGGGEGSDGDGGDDDAADESGGGANGIDRPLPTTRDGWIQALAEEPALWPAVPIAWRDDDLLHAAAGINLDVLEEAPLSYLQSGRLLEWVRRSLASATRIPPMAYTREAHAEALRLYGEQPDWLDFAERHAPPAGSGTKRWDHNGVYDVLGALLTEEDCVEAASQGGSLRHVPLWLRTPKVIQASLDGDIYNVSHVAPEWITPEVAHRAVRHDYGRLIQHVPEALLTEALCVASALANASTLQDMPERWRTPAVCIAALDEHSDAFAHVPEALQLEVLTTLIDRDTDGRDRTAAPGADGAPGTFWHFLRAVVRFRQGDHEGAIEDARRGIPSMRHEEDGHFLLACAHRALGREAQAVKHAALVLKEAGGGNYRPHRLLQDQDTGWLAQALQSGVDGLDDEALVARLADDPGLLARLPRSRITLAMAEQAVRADQDMVRHVPRRLLNPFLYLASVKAGRLHVMQVPPELHGEALFLAAIDQRQVYLDEVPEAWRTRAVCVAAVCRYARDMDHVPPALRDEVSSGVDARRQEEQAEEQHEAVPALSARVDRVLTDKVLGSDGKMSRFWLFLAIFKAMLGARLGPGHVDGSSRGVIGWLRARPLQLMLVHIVLSLLALGLHIAVTARVWQQTESVWATVLTGLGFFGFAELYWAWTWSRAHPVPVGWVLACAVVVLTAFGWNTFYRRVLKSRA